jgi:hypothetical protein
MCEVVAGLGPRRIPSCLSAGPEREHWGEEERTPSDPSVDRIKGALGKERKEILNLGHADSLLGRDTWRTGSSEYGIGLKSGGVVNSLFLLSPIPSPATAEAVVVFAPLSPSFSLLDLRQQPWHTIPTV